MRPIYKKMLKKMVEKEEGKTLCEGEEWFLYVVECVDGSYYTGVTKDVDRRLKMHNNGTASRYTRIRRPVKLIYKEDCLSRTQAFVRECKVKAMTKKEKKRLVTEGERMPTIFTKIINGEISCYKIDEDDCYLAFLDIRPINPGHTLVIPKKEINYIFDADDDLLAGLMIFAKKVAKKLKKTVECKRIGIMVAGLEVPHCHIHLVPIQSVRDLNFALAKETDPAQLSQMAEKIRQQ